MMSEIVLASDNLGKLREIKTFLDPLNIRLLSQSDFKISSVEETGLSFVENAILKARHAAQQTQLPALADDSGLVVDLLEGAPGIYSARYAGPNATSQDNIQKLLTTMKPFKEGDRTARFYCALAFVRQANDPIPLICQAQWEGIILSQPQGQEGFGYDPIFFLPHLNCTAAELSLEQKNKLSHRALALAQLAQQLKRLYPHITSTDA